MKILVCGSRDWTDKETIWSRIASLSPGSTILHGDARGADRIAGEAAWLRGCEVRKFPADWLRWGKRAGILRNLAMLDEAPDLVLAFQCGGSRGTQHTIDEARRRGIPVEVFLR